MAFMKRRCPTGCEETLKKISHVSIKKQTQNRPLGAGLVLRERRFLCNTGSDAILASALMSE